MTATKLPAQAEAVITVRHSEAASIDTCDASWEVIPSAHLRSASPSPSAASWKAAASEIPYEQGKSTPTPHRSGPHRGMPCNLFTERPSEQGNESSNDAAPPSYATAENHTEQFVAETLPSLQHPAVGQQRGLLFQPVGSQHDGISDLAAIRPPRPVHNGWPRDPLEIEELDSIVGTGQQLDLEAQRRRDRDVPLTVLERCRSRHSLYSAALFCAIAFSLALAFLLPVPRHR
jgi:hypothetical protein